jgi:hypothetical protein
MAWYNSAKDLKKSVSINNVKKVAGDVYSATTKKPTAAIYESVKQGSIKPLQQYGQGVYDQNIKNPINDAMNSAMNRAIGNKFGSAGAPIDQPNAVEKMKGLTFTGGDGSEFTGNYASSIGANEDPNAVKSSIANKYSALGELAKLREGSQAKTESSAMSRRLASSGMLGSGAGMRMQNQVQQESGRRMAQSNLGLAAEQAGMEQTASDTANARNIQREGMRVGAAESAATRGLQNASFQADKEFKTQQFDLDKATTLENQKIARDVQRYNDRGMIGQLFGDLFGGGSGISTKSIFGIPTGIN